jgi:hypothetical protein
MGSSVIQNSYAGGEIAPALYGRTDLARYMNSLKTCRNFIAQQYGGAKNRAGFRFVAEVKDSTKETVLLPFAFSTVQTYVLEFGNLYQRIIKNAGVVTEPTKAITGATAANPVAITSAAHGYLTGEEVYISDVVGMTAINGRNFKITVLTVNTYSLQDLAGNNINGTAYAAYVSGGTSARIYTVATPYAEADLTTLNYTQSADVMTVVHPSYYPRQVSRTGHAAWTVSNFANVNGPFQDINVDTGKTVTISAASGAGITVTASAPIFTADMVGTQFYIEQKNFGTPWEPGKAVLVGNIRRSDGKYYQALTAANTGSLRPTHDADIWSDGSVDWDFLHPGFGACTITAFTDSTHVTATAIARLPDEVITTATYKWAKSAWGGDQGYPSAVTYHQQRQVFAGTAGAPPTNWTSRVGNYVDFGTSQPLVDDDAITFRIPGRQVNAVRHLLPLDKLAVLTSGSEWVVGAGQTEVVTPSTISTKVQGYRGASKVVPIVVGSTAIFLQDKGKSVYEMGYDYTSDKYTGSDLTIPASHLFSGHAIVSWAYQQVPFQVIWAVRDDGVLLGLTYLKEQQVAGWHRHDTVRGFFESVCVISEDDEDVLHAVIRRTINGRSVRNIERMHTRTIRDIKDAFFVDSGLTYDGRNTSATTMAISGGTTWSYQAETFTLTASAAHFAAGDVGKEIHIPNDEQVIRLSITAYTSATVVTVSANRDIPAALRGVATTNWAQAASSLSGLWHLEAEILSILADGHVVFNGDPADDVAANFTVQNGRIALDRAYSVIHAGLPIEADFETLSINLVNQETLVDKKKLITTVRLLVEESRGIRVGPDENHLTEAKVRALENYDQPVESFTGVIEVRTQAKWDRNGTVFVRQSDPLPLTILASIPDLTSGGA